MKTPDEIKKALDYCASSDNNCCAPCPYDDYEPCKTVKLMRDALAYIQQLEAAQPKWISVEDRLPEDDELYLVFVSDRNEIDISRYYGDGEWLTNDLDSLTRYVTYWMSLPEPPKEVNHD